MDQSQVPYDLAYDNDLIQVKTSDKGDQALVVANAQQYLPRLKLCQGQAKEVSKGKVARGGNYALIRGKDEVEDATNEVEMVVVAARAKALRTGDMVISNFEPDSPTFQQIMEESKVKDSGCMYGPEYLVWLPAHDTFATLFMCNPTARRESPTVHARLRKPALLTSHLIETEKFAWFGPLCRDLSTPITNLPGAEVFQEQVDKFEGEKSSMVKAADSPEGGDRDR